MAIPSEFPFLYHGYEIIIHSSCILDFCCEPPRSSPGLCRNVQKFAIASHLKGLNPSLDFCCQGSALTGIKEGR